MEDVALTTRSVPSRILQSNVRAIHLRVMRLGLLLLVLALFSSGCALLEAPPQPIVPTLEPPPTPDEDSVDFDALTEDTAEIGSVGFTVDPDIAALLNNISRQNLFAYVRALESFGTRHTLSPTEPATFGIGAARQWIYDELNRIGAERLEVRIDEFPLTYAGLATTQQNVIATLPGEGNHPGLIVVMAHYDSRNENPDDGEGQAPGADDNASGVAVLMEAARLLSTRTWQQTIVFAFLAAEEQGTFGSRHFVQDLLLDGRTIDVAINNDIVGGRPGIPQSLRVFAPGPENSRPIQLARYLNVIAEMYSPMFTLEIQQAPDREGRYGDHREFLSAGIAAVRLTESVEDVGAQHSAQDTSDRLDYEYLVQVTRLNVAALANMAGTPPAPPPPTVAPMANAGSYLLTWPKDERAAGYAVMARPLGSYEAEMRYVNAAEAGNVAIAGLNVGQIYNVSLAALDARGRIGLFSPETIVGEGTDDGSAIDASSAITETSSR